MLKALGIRAPIPQPFCFLMTQFTRHFLVLSTSPEFRLSPFGTVHMRQRIIVHTPMSEALFQSCDLRSSVVKVSETKRGIAVDVKCMAVPSEGERKPLWTGLTTMLSTNAATQRRTGHLAVATQRKMTVHLAEPFAGIEGVWSVWYVWNVWNVWSVWNVCV